MRRMCRVQLVFLPIVLKPAGGHLHASCSTTRGLPLYFASWCAEVMQDSTIHSFRPLLIFREKKPRRKQLLYRFSHPCENWTTQVVLQYFNFQCQIYEQWANNYPRRNRVETGMRQILLLLLCRVTYLWKEPGTIHLSVPDECSTALQTASYYKGSSLCYCPAFHVSCKP